jgi:hypothetical protein
MCYISPVVRTTTIDERREYVTPYVTNHPGNFDHVSVNPNDPKEIDFSNEEIEIQTSVVIDPNALPLSKLRQYQEKHK